jgi:hypothetical protein
MLQNGHAIAGVYYDGSHLGESNALRFAEAEVEDWGTDRGGKPVAARVADQFSLVFSIHISLQTYPDRVSGSPARRTRHAAA